VRIRSALAASVGIGAAALAHWLDASGRLPFVHEEAAIRQGMSGAQVVCWLALAAGLAAVAASRPFLVGIPSAVAVAAIPELLVRPDPGAVLEPAALTGALVQLLLIATVAALAVAIERRARAFSALTPFAPQRAVPGASLHDRRPSYEADTVRRPRAPPHLFCPVHS
jgi:hypothetical protein